MAICDVCQREMTTADSCADWDAFIQGRAWRPTRYGDERRPEPPDEECEVDWDDWDEDPWPLPRPAAPRPPAEPEPWPPRCGDCGVALGANHHPGCDLAQCPRCTQQMISCGCWSGDVLVLPEGLSEHPDR